MGPGFRRNTGLRGRSSNTKLSKSLPEAGQDLLGIKLQRARLIRTGRMKHEMAETEIDIEADLFDLLVRVARDDPAAGSAVERQRVGEPLHLDRVLNPDLLLGRQRQRCPVPRVFLRALRIGV